jgi:hypothetical protein
MHLEKTFQPGNLRRINLYGSSGTICKFGCYHSSNHGIQPFMEIILSLKALNLQGRGTYKCLGVKILSISTLSQWG